MGILSFINDMKIGMSNKKFAQGVVKLKTLSEQREISFDQLKDTLTDPEVVEIFTIGFSSSMISPSIGMVAYIIECCAEKLPTEKTLDFIDFLANNAVTNEIIHRSKERPINQIGWALITLFEKIPPNKKRTLADILAKNDFGQIIMHKTPHIQRAIKYLALGLDPKEFNTFLTRSKLFAHCSSSESFQKLLLFESYIRGIARDILIYTEPFLREKFKHEGNIDKIDVDSVTKQRYIGQAQEIVEIALSHCKGEAVVPGNSLKKTFSFLDNNLIENEIIAYRAKLHWITFFWPIVWFSISAIIFIFAKNNGTMKDAIIFACLPLIITVITSIGPLVNYFTSEFGVTNKRVIAKFGFIKRRSLEVLLKKVESIMVDQSILGRILGYGTIVIIGTGATEERLNKIQDPFEYRQKMQKQISALENE